MLQVKNMKRLLVFYMQNDNGLVELVMDCITETRVVGVYVIGCSEL